MSAQKVLLMGRTNAGKTSMRSIVFANYSARETSRLASTEGYDVAAMRFLGALDLTLWDCGGQDVFMENYFESQRGQVFSGVSTLIYVMGALGDKLFEPSFEQDIKSFGTTLSNLHEMSPEAQVYVFVHKIDLVKNKKQKSEVLQRYREKIEETNMDRMRIAGVMVTSIWDETLFAAWSQVVNNMIPDLHLLTQEVDHFAEECEAAEVVLFEVNTLLVITSSTRATMSDPHRFEKISNIVKQFKLSCGRTQTAFQTLTVRNAAFTARIQRFTEHTFLLVVATGREENRPADGILELNTDIARKRFQMLASAGFGFSQNL